MPAEEHLQYVPESPEVRTRLVLFCGLIVLVLLGAGIGVLHAVYERGVPVKTVPAPQHFPQPRVETSEAETAERQRLDAAQTESLKTWKWANDQHTLVQVPIERAMKLLAERGGNAYAPLIAPQPALSSPTAGAENIVTPNPPAKPDNPPPQEKQP